MDENNSTSILGYVSIVPKGEYSPTTTYNRLNVVSYEGGSFMFISTTPASGVTPVDGNTWMQLCSPGEGVTVSAQEVAYAENNQGATPPETGWQTAIPEVSAGNYLWSRITTTFSDGSTYNAYMVTRFGIDGSGAVSTVNGVSPDATGNVQLTLGSIATVDNTPTINSQNLVTSGGVYARINAVLSSTQVKIQPGTITLPAASWVGSGPYTQPITVAGATAQSQINIQGNQTAIAAANSGGFSVLISNTGGALTAYAIGAKPASDLALQITIVELSGATGTIVGAPLVGNMPLTAASINSALGYNPGMVNPNLLVNWYFVGGGQFPINQRGQTEYTTTGYGIDRWWSIFTRVKVDNGIVLESTDTTYGANLRQAISPEILTALRGKTVTLSVLVESGSGTMGLALATGMNTGQTVIANVACTAGITTYTVVLPETVGSAAYTYLLFRFTTAVGTSIKILAAKLELGSVQTLAHQENGVWVLNEMPDYGEQLARCQRYYQIRSANNIEAVDMRPTMRLSSPTITSVAGGYAYSADL